MKILLVSFFFPPGNAIGAVRVGKLARHMLAAGHDVRVLTVKNTGLSNDLEVEIPESRIVRTGWTNINALPFAFLRHKQTNSRPENGDVSPFMDALGKCYRAMLNFPDGQVGWYRPAVRAGMELLSEWRADIIYASAVPFTSLWVAASLSHRFGIPWVSEFRDLWTSSPYYDLPRWRHWLDQHLERHILKQVAGMVTVSEPLAETLRMEHQVPVEVILNG